MTIGLFKKVVLIVAALDVTWFVVTGVLINQLPPELVAYQKASYAARQADFWRYQLVSICEAVLAVCWFANLVGIYKLRPKSRVRFLLIQGIIFGFELFTDAEVMNPVVFFFNDASEIGHGVLLALLYWSPIAACFKPVSQPH